MSRVQTRERFSGGKELADAISVDYAAVPLDLSVDDMQYCSYAQDSLGRINQRVNDAFDKATVTDWVTSLELADELKLLVRESLVTSHWERLDRNRASGISSFIDLDDVHIQRALAGTATPLELLYVLEKYPKVETIELAKLSHPLDAEASQEMHHAVMLALNNLGEAVLPGKPRYKRKTARDDIPAAIILRKQIISEYLAEQGKIQVVQRAAFLTRGDDEAVVSPFLDRKVRNPTRIDELGQKIEAYLPHIQQDFRWLQPIATSYYAKYLTEGKV